jgi:hypothetical protein
MLFKVAATFDIVAGLILINCNPRLAIVNNRLIPIGSWPKKFDNKATAAPLDLYVLAR